MQENFSNMPCAPLSSRTSKIRKIYILRLVGRIFVLLACVALLIIAPGQFNVLEGWNFFKIPSPLSS